MSAPEPWDDSTHDAIAATEAAMDGDVEGLAAILRHANVYSTTVTLAKLLAELVTMTEHNEGVARCCFRTWAETAINRS